MCSSIGQTPFEAGTSLVARCGLHVFSAVAIGLCICQAVFAQTSSPPTSADPDLTQPVSLNQEGQQLVKRAAESLKTGDNEQALSLFQNAYLRFDASGNTESQAICRYNQGTILLNLGRHDKALNSFKEALVLFEALPDLKKYKAMCLGNLGNALLALGRHDEAVAALEKALALLEALPGMEEYRAMCLGSSGDALRALGRQVEALECFAVAADLYAPLRGKERDRASCLHSEGCLLGDLRRPMEAVELLKAALALYTHLPNTEKNQALCLYNMGVALGNLPSPVEALEKFQMALKLYESLPDTTLDQAICLGNMGVMQKDLERYSEAIELHQCALELFVSLPNTEISQAMCLSNIGCALTSLCRFEEALTRHEAALRLCVSLPNTNLDQADHQYNIAVVLTQLGRPSEALESCEKARVLYASLQGTEAQQVMCLENMGIALCKLGLPAEALERFESALDLCTPREELAAKRIDCLINIGNALGGLRRTSEALEHYTDALELCASQPDSGKKRATILNSTGCALHDLGHHEESLEALEAAWKHYEVLPNMELDRGGCLNNMGNALLALGSNSEAVARYRAAMKLYASQQNTEREQADCLYNMGNALCLMGRTAEGLECYNTALALYAAMPNGAGNQGECLFNIGFTNCQMAEWCQGIQQLYEGYRKDWQQAVPNLPFMTEQQKVAFLQASLNSPFSVYTASLTHTDCAEVGRCGLETALLAKGLSEWAMRQEQGVFREVAPQDWQHDFDELQGLKQELQALTLSLQTSASAAFDEGESNEARAERIRKTGERLGVLRGQIQQRENDLARRNADFAKEMELQAVDVAAISEALSRQGEDAVLLEYVKFWRTDFSTGDSREEDAQYGVFVLIPGHEPAGISLGPAAPIEDAVKAYQDTVMNVLTLGVAPGRSGWRQLEQDARIVGDTLRTLILDPIRERLGEKKRLFIAPDAVLFSVPFEALPVSQTQTEEPRYLVEDHEVVYLNSGRELLLFDGRDRKQTPSRDTAVIVAGPAFDLPEGDRARETAAFCLSATEDTSRQQLLAWSSDFETDSASEGAMDTLGVKGHNFRAGFTEIPEAVAFGEMIADKLRASGYCKNTELYTGHQAIEWRIRNVEAPRVLQILTHGCFLGLLDVKDQTLQMEITSVFRPYVQPPEFHNPLLRSMLGLAGASISTPARVYRKGADWLTGEEWDRLEETERARYEMAVLDDGLLTAYEVTGMNLYGTELVALTACQTAQGETSTGQGTAGLRRAFLLAGAQSMIMAQWSVPVEYSMDQMNRFYDGWLGKEKADSRYAAFRNSQLAELDSARNEYGAGHPWLWAGFVYIGDPGEISKSVF